MARETTMGPLQTNTDTVQRLQRSGARTRTVLLTAFGPFPSVPVNATMILVPRLAVAARQQFQNVSFVTDVLPTEWLVAMARVDQLMAQHKPDLVLMFGVSGRARGLEIESLARNVCAVKPDAAGACPEDTRVHAAGADTHASRVPVADIIRRVALRGTPVFQSWDAGTYLCNATLYHVLASTSDPSVQAGFVHVPTLLAPLDLSADRLADGSPGDGAPLETAPGCPLTWGQAIEGGLDMLAVCLGEPSPAQGRDVANAPRTL